MNTRFKGNFTQQEALPESAIEAAVAVMRSGRLHRYNVATPDDPGETALLESEFAAYQQQRFCLACASGGYAIQLALRAAGVEHGAPVLTNGFTLSPVPGAITAVGGRPILVESTPDLVIDIAHLDAMIETSGAKWLVLSHMRGHIVDMHALLQTLNHHGVQLVEDCAHTMGSTFDGKMSGTHGLVACFSTQTYKHINSGEGGLLTSDDEALMARAVMLSGSYMLYGRHAAAPDVAAYEERRYDTPNLSGRMDNLRAAILRPQLQQLDANGLRWQRRYDAMAAVLQTSQHLVMPQRHPLAAEVRSSLQFLLPSVTEDRALQFVELAKDRGVELKWFGAKEPVAYTSRHDSWRYLPHTSLPTTDRILQGLFDVRLPLTFSTDDCETIAGIIVDCINSITG